MGEKSENKCPFCGAEESYLTGPNYYKCDTFRYPNGNYERGEICKQTELTALKDELENILLKDRGKTNEINLLTKENRRLETELTGLKVLVRELGKLKFETTFRAYYYAIQKILARPEVKAIMEGK